MKLVSLDLYKCSVKRVKDMLRKSGVDPIMDVVASKSSGSTDAKAIKYASVNFSHKFVMWTRLTPRSDPDPTLLLLSNPSLF